MLTVLFTIISFTTFAQKKSEYTIKGTVIDSTTLKPIAYATIALIKDDSTKLIVNAVPSDVNGKYELKAKTEGKYIVAASFVGYGSKGIELSLGLDKNVDIGDIFLKEGVAMDEIVVVSNTPLVTSTPDKLTYNMEADPESATSNTLEILRKVPMLSVDGDDKVRLNGEGNYKVLVNGRNSTMMTKNFNDVIKSMPASSIKSIEVITNPPTKYDADGIAGIINIITHRGSLSGFNGSVNLSVDNNGSINSGVYIAAQTGKFAISTNISGGKYVSRPSFSERETTYHNNDKYHQAISNGENGGSNNNNGNFSIEASYEIDSLNLITLSGWGYLGGYGSDNSGETSYFDNIGNLTRKFTNSSDSKGEYGSLSGSINYQKSFKKPDKTFTLSYNVDANPGSSSFTSTIDGILDYDSYQQYSNNDATGMSHTAQVDFYNPVSEKHQYEFGAKYILRINTSDTEVEERSDLEAPWEPAPQKVNDLDYDQHISSLYGGYVFKHKKFTAKGGFRAELGINEGVSKSYKGDMEFNSDPLFNVVPYVNMSLMLNKGQNITASYTQRLNRPGIYQLNPYVNDNDPMNIYYGNPELETVVAHSYSLGYRKTTQRWNLFVGGNSYISNNSIERITKSDENGRLESSYSNIGKNKNFRLNTSFSYYKPKFNIYTNGAVSYTSVKSTSNDIENSGYSGSMFMGGSYKIWKNGSLNANGGYFVSSVTLQGSSAAYYYYSLGLTQRLLEQKLSISLYANNPFTKNFEYRYETIDENFSSIGRSWRVNRSFRLGVNMRFGKTNAQVKKTRRSIKNDDLMSGGSSQGGGGGTGGGQ